MGFVGHISIGYKAENALLFFGFELLRGNLLLGITHSNCPLHSQNAKFDVGESFVLPGFDCNGRTPVCKSFSRDSDLVDDSWRNIGECKGSVLLRYGGETIASWPLKDDGGIGNRIVADIDHGTEDASCLCIWWFSRLRGHGYNKEQSTSQEDQ